jgi:hypothetical protein
MLLQLLASAAAAIVASQLAKILYNLLYAHFNSPFRYMPGPPSPSFFLGYAGKLHVCIHPAYPMHE